MTKRELLVAIGLLEKAKEILLDEGPDDLAVTAATFHIDNALDEVNEIRPDEIQK
jgi:hypothetical protein